MGGSNNTTREQVRLPRYCTHVMLSLLSLGKRVSTIGQYANEFYNYRHALLAVQVAFTYTSTIAQLLIA